MIIQEQVPIGRRTTMRIGGSARYYAELTSRSDVEEAYRFAAEKHIPLIPLGGGSNTIFAEGEIAALVVRIQHNSVEKRGDGWRIGAGKILASLIQELAHQHMDGSALTGIPGTIGGAVFGNAGQGPKGIWIDRYVRGVTVFESGLWQELYPEECHFRYRESHFKDRANGSIPPLIWEVQCVFPQRPAAEILAEIERLIQKRIETQPHLKTAGSCFKALPDGTPAWQLIEAAGLRGQRFGGIEISQKHANFLLNVEQGTYGDVLAAIGAVQAAVPQIAGVEMRLYEQSGALHQSKTANPQA